MPEFLTTLHYLVVDHKDDRGATAVEYGLIVALIAAVIIAVVGFLGADVLASFDTVENAIGGSQG